MWDVCLCLNIALNDHFMTLCSNEDGKPHSLLTFGFPLIYSILMGFDARRERPTNSTHKYTHPHRQFTQLSMYPRPSTQSSKADQSRNGRRETETEKERRKNGRKRERG